MGDLKNDIEKYLRGELSSAERNALERKALQDPFLADALEGAASIEVEDFSHDLKSLQASLQDRVAESKTKVVPLWKWTLRIAAGLLIVLVGSFVFWQLNDQTEHENLLSENTPKQEAPSGKPSSSTAPDATTNDSGQNEVVLPSRDIAENDVRDENAAEQSGAVAKERISTASAAEPALQRSKEEEQQMIALQEELAVSPTEDVMMDSVVTLQPKPADDLMGRVAGVQIAPAPSAPAKPFSRAEMESTLSKKKSLDSGEARNLAYNADQNGYTNSDAELKKAEESAPIRLRGTATIGPSGSNDYVIVGRVTDSEDGDGLPGVNVLVKGTNYGTVTDGEGNYRLKVDELAPSLVFTFVGMESKEIKVEGEREVNVAMANDMTQLSEIVVVGYGAEKIEEEPGHMEFASPMGGRTEFKKYLEGNMRYPQQALANEIEGKVTIQFTVATSGDLSEFRVVRGIGYGCDEEVMRLIKNGPKWNPTRKGGEPVVGKMRVKVRFRLPK